MFPRFFDESYLDTGEISNFVEFRKIGDIFVVFLFQSVCVNTKYQTIALRTKYMEWDISHLVLEFFVTLDHFNTTCLFLIYLLQVNFSIMNHLLM